MRKSVVWIGIVILIVGAVVYLIGGILDLNTYDTYMTAIEEDSTSILLETYEQRKVAQTVAMLGFTLAFVGIAVGFAGMTIESAPQPRIPYGMPQQPPQQYPPEQPPPYPPQP